MGRSSLLGTDSAPAVRPGHDTASLGPSDSSDTGSDMAGIENLDDEDPSAPVDHGLRADGDRSETPPESIAPGIDSDLSGTGERRSAGSDAGAREAADISPDRVFVPEGDIDPDDAEALGLDDASAQALVNAAADATNDEEQAARKAPRGAATRRAG